MQTRDSDEIIFTNFCRNIINVVRFATFIDGRQKMAYFSTDGLSWDSVQCGRIMKAVGTHE